MSDLLSRLDEFEAPHKDVPVCLKKNLLKARDEANIAMATADLKARQAQRVDDARLAQSAPSESPEFIAAKKRVAEIDEQIKAASIILRIRGVDRNTYNDWMLKSPPRKGIDAEGYNPSKFYTLAVQSSAVYVDANGDEHPISAAEWQTIDAKLSDGEFDRLAAAVHWVNRESGRVDVSPFVSGSEPTGDSFGISASRARSGSRRAASGAGSQRKSTSKT